MEHYINRSHKGVAMHGKGTVHAIVVVTAVKDINLGSIVGHIYSLIYPLQTNYTGDHKASKDIWITKTMPQ